MNCAPGDLVMFKGLPGPAAPLNGLIAYLSRNPPERHAGVVLWELDEPQEFVAAAAGYDVDGSGFVAGNRLLVRRVSDANVTPIRYRSGTDETLQIAGLPPITVQRMEELAQEMGMLLRKDQR